MIIAVASGKGGTGKTTVSSSLIHVWPDQVIAMDLDVEEPNLYLFLHPTITQTRQAVLHVPRVDAAKCTYCRICADFCQFKAISVLGNTLLTFPDMCHGCGGCITLCPEKALTPGARVLGDICSGAAGRNDFIMGRLRVGEAMSPPLMRAVKSSLAVFGQDGKDIIIDAPPGVSCPAVNAVMDSDLILLVTEPTPFGLYDLQLAIDAFTPLGKPLAVVINRSDIGNEAVSDLCRRTQVPVLAKIPFRRDIAQIYANGGIVADELPDVRTLFKNLAKQIRQFATPAKEMANA